MTTNESSVTDRLDVRARDIARLALTGETTEVEARRAIAAILVQADIPAYVSRGVREIDQQTRIDLTERLQELQVIKVMQQTDGGLNLGMLLDGASLSGWARNLARIAAQSKLRDIRKVTNRESLIDPLDAGRENEFGEVYSSYAETMFHTASVEFDTDLEDDTEEDTDRITENFAAAAGGLRPSGYLRLAAAAFLKSSQLPAVVRPENPIDREWVRTVATEDVALVRKSIIAMQNLVVDVMTDEDRLINTRLLALWDDYSADNMATLLKMPDKAIQLLIWSAVSQFPRPSRDVIAMSLRTMRMADEGTNWKTLTRDLLDSWLATEAEAFSEFDTKGGRDEDKAKARVTAALNWPTVVAEVIARKGSPLGRTEEDVSRWITSTFPVAS